jgi:hypothetical protein
VNCKKHDISVFGCSKWVGDDPELVCQKCIKGEENGIGEELSGEVDFGSRPYESIGLEKSGIGSDEDSKGSPLCQDFPEEQGLFSL